ncbi:MULTISPECIES: RNA polymerase sigma factor [unclassified Streptomyces]|uniref:RNA polymerase sigma factor n=1 Tax=unclassified Streptomyces TaxID=2593676 RepID=UPI00210B331C|nr:MULTISPECIES: RNA polymerase sigma factor [unclassified Streptomyces]
MLARSARDPAAFEPLVGRHSAPLHGYLARRAPTAADDLLAEVWLRAFAGRSGFDPARGTARAWLFGVARHVLAGHWRGLAAEGPAGSVGGGVGGASWSTGAAGASAAEPVTDPWQAVDQRLDAAAVAPLIRHTLAELPGVERELLLLVIWEQLTPAEAADVVGVPQGTARSRLHRARTRLRDALTPAAVSGAMTGDLA